MYIPLPEYCNARDTLKTFNHNRFRTVHRIVSQLWIYSGGIGSQCDMRDDEENPERRSWEEFKVSLFKHQLE